MNKDIWDRLFIKNIFIVLGLFWGSRTVCTLIKSGVKDFSPGKVVGIVSFGVAIVLVIRLLKYLLSETGQKYLKSSIVTFFIYWSILISTILLEGCIDILVLAVYSLGVWLAALFMAAKRSLHSFEILENQCPNIIFRYHKIKNHKKKLKFLEDELTALTQSECSETVLSAIEERASSVYVLALHFETIVVTSIILASIPHAIR